MYKVDAAPQLAGLGIDLTTLMSATGAASASVTPTMPTDSFNWTSFLTGVDKALATGADLYSSYVSKEVQDSQLQLARLQAEAYGDAANAARAAELLARSQEMSSNVAPPLPSAPTGKLPVALIAGGVGLLALAFFMKKRGPVRRSLGAGGRR